MACIKCGRDTEENQVFCSGCLAVMEQYPVKPGTAVQLPRPRTEPVFRKAPKRKTPSLEEQVKLLQNRVRILVFSLLIAILLAGFLAIPAYEHLFNESWALGQNYNTVVQTTETASAGN